MNVPAFVTAFAVLTIFSAGPCWSEERRESFDSDPGWDGRNHRASEPPPRTVRQDFGYSRTRHAGGEALGEIGGLFTPAAEPAYYAKPIPPRDVQ